MCKCPPPVPILNQLDPVHTPTSQFLKIHIYIILSSTAGSPQWSLSLRFPYQNAVHTFPPPQYTQHAQPISLFSNLSPEEYSIYNVTFPNPTNNGVDNPKVITKFSLPSVRITEIGLNNTKLNILSSYIRPPPPPSIHNPILRQEFCGGHKTSMQLKFTTSRHVVT
jgi:hypothetical protein